MHCRAVNIADLTPCTPIAASSIEWTRQFHAAMEPWSAGSVYVNSLDQDDAARVPEVYAKNYARLSMVKAAYDPDNRFRRNQNIRPHIQAAAW